ncbi:MAG: winged helix-turn-helix transcriptional regulator [Bacteroidales bacterium]|nr:winged helix-turn-helix transcriptional regulator [Bacteroidales bacterium]
MTESNRIEFKRELTDEPRVSIPRNKELMRIFRDVEMVESLGSGMPRIMEVYGRECFTFMEHFIRFTVPFYKNVTDNVTEGNANSQNHVEKGQEHVEMDIEHVEKDEKYVEKSQEYVEKDEKHVEKTSELILEIIRKEPSITMNELAKRTGLVRRSIEDQINRLKRKNLIRRVGSRKYGHWEIIEEASDN